MDLTHNGRLKAYTSTQKFGLLGGIVLFFLIFFIIPIEGLSREGVGVLATLSLMATWWITEAINTGITGLIPLILFPITGALAAGPTAAAYGSTTIFMFFGGFAISIALERWNLHNRISLNIIKIIGTSMQRLILGLLVASGFISMWVSNTATILMLLPIALAIARKMNDLMALEGDYSDEDAHNFKKQAIFAVGFGATIGGSTTIIGTPTNMILSGFSSSLLGMQISFSSFLIFMLPFSLIQYAVSYFLLTKIFFQVKSKNLVNAKQLIQDEINKLGTMIFEEKATLTIFILTVFFWLTRTYLFKDVPGLDDMTISIAACVMFYIVPNKRGSRLLDADSIKKIPWSVVLMLMGGMAIAAGFTKTDLASYLGSLLLFFESSTPFVLTSIVSVFGLLITQIAPNTASSTILVPIAASIAGSINIHPFLLMLPAALATGFATTLPSGTPVMGIMYGSGEFHVKDLIKVGGSLAIVSLVLIIIFTSLFASSVFGL